LIKKEFLSFTTHSDIILLQPIKNNFRIYFTIAIYIIWVVTFSRFNYFKEKQHLYSELDQELENAALTIPSILPKGLHRKDMNKKDLSEQQDLTITLTLSEYTQRTDIVYLSMLVLQDNKFFYTSSSASDTELKSKTFAVNYFKYYADAAPDITVMFEQNQSKTHESSNKWGDFRSILIPINADDGSVYIVGADISVSHIDTLLNDALYSNLIILALFLLFACPLIITLSLEPRRQVRLLAKQTSELFESEAKLTSIFEHSPVGILHYDNKGVIQKTNKRAERNTLVGFNMLERLENTELLNMVKQSLQGKVNVYEGPYTSVSGQRFMHLHANLLPLYSSSGALEGGIGVFNDITEKQQSTYNLKTIYGC
jgi:PAS domain S-box-containing protein